MAKVFTCKLYSNVSKKWVPARFERFKRTDIPRLTRENWNLEFDEDYKKNKVDVFKLIPSDKPNRIEGIVSFSIVEGYMYIYNFERYKWKTNDDYKESGLALIGLACLFSFKNELKGKVSLKPKNPHRLKDYYTKIGLKFVSLHNKFYIEDPLLARNFINTFDIK